MDLTTIFCVKIQIFLVCNKIWSLLYKKVVQISLIADILIFSHLTFFPPSPMIFWHFFLPKLLLLVYCFSDCIYFFTPNHALGKFFPNTDCLCFCVSCIYFDAFACFLTFSIILSKQRNISFVPDFFNLPWRYTKKLLPTVQNNFSHQKSIRYFSGLTECCPLCISNPKSSVLKKIAKQKNHPCLVKSVKPLTHIAHCTVGKSTIFCSIRIIFWATF